MDVWEVIVEIWNNAKAFILGIKADQIALVSVVVTLILFVAGQRSETKFKKHEVRRQEYKKFIEFLEESLSGKLNVNDPENKSKFFDMGVSLFLYGSKRVYKKYLFFREYATNPIVQKSKHNNGKVIMYVVADILSTIRHEVGLTSISELEPNEVMSFFVNDIGTNPLSRIDAYKARYSIFMIKCEVFFFNRYKLVTTQKVFYRWIKPIFGVVATFLKYSLAGIKRVTDIMLPTENAEKEQRQSSPKKKTKASVSIRNNNPQNKKNLVEKFFEHEWSAQNWVVRNIWKKRKLFGFIDKIAFFSFLFVMCAAATINSFSSVAFYILAVLGAIMMLCSILKDTQHAMTTLGGFLRVGMSLLVAASFLLIILFAAVFKDALAGIMGQYMICILISAVLAVLWGAYSSFCNASVATLANALLTGAFGLVVLTCDLLTKTMLIELPGVYFGTELTLYLEELGFSLSQFADGMCALVCYPFLLMTGFATMVCAAKKYWIDKYNGGQDIETLVEGTSGATKV